MRGSTAPIREHHADAAVELLREHGRDGIALVAPAHLPLEPMNVHASRRVSAEDAEAAVRFLAATDLLIAPVDDELLVDALRIASAERQSLYDAVFIALAARLDAELVTADPRQAETAACRTRLV